MIIQSFPSRYFRLAVAAAVLAFLPRAGALITSTTYPMFQTGGAPLENMTSGTTQLVGPSVDDDSSGVFDIGFDFWYDGVRYSQFSVNPNGICRLGSDPVSTSYDNSDVFASVTDSPKICPYFDDLFVGTNGKVHYKVIGAAPNRILVIEWSNVQVPYVGSGTGAATFQLKLNESTGVINFVYGPGVGVNTDNGGYSVGLQSGAETNLASITTQFGTTSYTTANSTQVNGINSGTSYNWTPPTPNPPTSLTFTNVTSNAIRLNWTDNASNEVGYVIYRSTDGTNYTFLAQTAADTNNFTASNLTPNTTYFWRVYAVTSGRLSTVLAGSRATNPIGNIVSVSDPAQVRNWSSTSTWVGGVVPTSGDNVTIAANREVVIDTDAQALNLTVSSGSILRYEPTTARTLTVTQSISIAANGTLTTSLNQASTQTGHVLSVGGNITNNGTLDFSTYPGASGNSAAAKIVFTGVTDASFTGPGQNTDLREVELNKSALATLTMNFSGPFSVQGGNTAGFLTLTGGTFRLAGTGTVGNPVFKTASYVIPPTAAFWLDNPNFTVTGTASGDTTSNDGFLRVSQGTFNVGISGADSLRGSDNATFLIEGGSLNCAGAFSPQGAVTYMQTGGTVNVAQVDNTHDDVGSFELFNSDSQFIMNGGSIVVHKRNSSGLPVDYRVQSETVDLTPTNNPVVYFGAADTAPSSTMAVQGPVPNLQIHPNVSATATAALVMQGSSFVNNGAIRSSATGSFTFAGPGAMTYSGIGTFGTTGVPFNGGGVSCSSPGLVTLNAPMVVTRANLIEGGFVHSNQLSIVSSGISTATVQIGGGGGTEVLGGSFDVTPNYNPTDPPNILYLEEMNARTTGLEIPSSRSLRSLTVANPNNVTMLGGNLTLTGTGTVLDLTSGRLITNGNMVIVANGSATTTRNTGWVDGNLRQTFSSNSSKTFDVGTATDYSPVSINVTAGATGQPVTVRVNQGQHPNYPPGYASYTAGLQRYWTISDSGNVTGSLTFFYPQADVRGIETNYKIAKFSNGTFSTPASQAADFNLNAIAANNQTGISGDWLVIESDADFDGLPDSYELAHTSPASATALAANGDLDGDGRSNVDEYFAGTNPEDANSVLRIVSVARAGTTCTIKFNAVAQKRYRLEYKQSLTNANWQNAGLPDLVSGVTGIAQFTDLSAAPPRKLYRVSLVTP